jgi:DNA-directed RNA polymerase beta subunit/DNA-directed RNA polymerase beta' subunit
MNQFQEITKLHLEKVIKSIKSTFPIEGSHQIIDVDNIRVKNDVDLYDYNKQRDQKWNNKTFEVSIVGEVILKDKKTGKVLDKKTVLLGKTPVPTQRATYIVNGVEYVVPTQMRLMPGVYHEKKADNTIQANFNQINLKGRNIKLKLNPNDLSFNIQYGNSHFPVVQFLQNLGISEEEIVKSVGSNIYNANKNKKFSFDKLFKALDYKELPKNPKEEFINLLGKTVLSPDTTKITLGKSYEKVSPDVILKSANKLVGILRGVENEDKRDNLAFKQFIAPEDLLAERVKASYHLKNRIKNNVDRFKDINRMGMAGLFTAPFKEFFNKTQISNVETFTGPMSVFGSRNKVTIMGEGGIKDIHTVTDAQREINPSTFLFLDPIHTPDNLKVGTTLHLTSAYNKTVNGKPMVTVYNRKTKKMEDIDPAVMITEPVGINKEGKNWKAVLNGKTETLPDSKIKYIVPFKEMFFSDLSNLVPFINYNSGNRLLLGLKFIESSLPLKNSEPPLVKTSLNGKSFSGALLDSSGMLNDKAQEDGVVTKVTKEDIYIKTKNKKVIKQSQPYLYPLQDGFMSSISKVKVGDKVKKGQILYDTNFTKDGDLSFGKNLLTAFMSYKGINTDDGIVISESAAKKLVSEHLYPYELQKDSVTATDMKRYLANFPGAFTTKQLENIDPDGVIKEGSIINPDDPVILVSRKEPPSPEELLLGKFHKSLLMPNKDRSLVWDKSCMGKVEKVIKTNKMIKVYIRTEETTRQGDKLGNIYGNKGVVNVIPDNEMPKTKDNRVIDIILNPLGVIGRLNTGQILALGAGKIAEKTGKPYMVQNFSEENYVKKIHKELKDLKINDKEDLIDPSGKVLKNVLVGPQYMLKLKHRSEKKLQSRGAGPTEAYSFDGLPVGSSDGGAQSLGHLGLYAMLAHGATESLYESQTYKGDFNPDFWYAMQSGAPLPKPKVPMTFLKFEGFMKALGVNTVRSKNTLQFTPLTDKNIMEISAGELKNPTKLIVTKKGEITPEPDGLFDQKITGGIIGNKYSHINLNAYVPNPIFERAICTVLGITSVEFEKLLTGKLGVSDQGKISEDGKLKLGDGFKKLFEGINVKKELINAEERIKNVNDQEKSVLNRKIKILRNLNKLDMKPEDAFLKKKMIVLPPFFRPVIQKREGGILTNDLNGLYKTIGIFNKQIEDTKVLPQADQAGAYYNLYNAIKEFEVEGGTAGMSKRQSKSVMDIIIGPSPKYGYYQNNLLKKRQDLSGRGVITPDVNLGLDEIGIPEDMAWSIYNPIIIRRLAQAGYPVIKAKELLKNKDPIAKRFLEKEISDRPVFFKRDPALHKYGIMGFYPKLIKDNTIHTNPLVGSGYAFDYDGNTLLNKKIILLDTELNTILYVNKNNFPKGELKSKKGNKEIYNVDSKYRVLSFDPVKQVLDWFPIDDFSLHKDIEFCKVYSRFGEEIEVSNDHSLFCLNEKFETIRIEPRNAVGMLTPRPKVVRPQEIKATINIPELNKKDVPLDFNFGYLIGIYVAEGSNSYTHGNIHGDCNLVSVNDSILNRVKNFLENNFGFKFNYRFYEKRNGAFCKGKYLSKQMKFYSKKFSHFLENTVGHGAVNKHLPQYFLNTPEEFRCGLISGLLAGDGTISVAKAKCKKTPSFIVRYDSISEQLMYQMALLLSTMGVRSSISSYTPSGLYAKVEKCYYINIYTVDFANLKDKIKTYHEVKDIHLEELFNQDYSSSIGASRNDLIPFNDSLKRGLKKLISRINNKNLNKLTQKFNNYITRKTAKKIVSALGEEKIKSIDYGGMWLKFIKNEDTWWDLIKKVEPISGKMEGYDLTVPGSNTFVTDDLFTVFDTMAIFAPLTDASVEEAKKMLPSNNLFSVSTGRLMWSPKQDSILGLFMISRDGKNTSKKFKNSQDALQAWKAGKLEPDDIVSIKGTKTTAGRELINSILPEYAKLTGPATSKSISNALSKIAKKSPKDYSNILGSLREIGNNAAYQSAFSAGIDDLMISDSLAKERDSIWKDAEKAASKSKTSSEKNAIFKAAREKSVLLTSKLPKDNAFKIMIDSGAKSKKDELAQMLFGQIIQDNENNFLNTPIKKGYNEGLSIPDFLNSMYGARIGIINKAKETSEPGKLTKLTMNSLLDVRVTDTDCGATKGVAMSLDDFNIIGRYTAGNQKVGKKLLNHNTVITPELASSLNKMRSQTVIVRSPLKCNAVHGICQKCMGLNTNGDAHPKGDFVGVKAVHSLGEPTTQLVISAWHTGTGVGPFKELGVLLETPENVPNEAVLAKVQGKINKITKNTDLGGFNVTIDKTIQWVPSGKELTVKKGQRVSKGDQISQGMPDPKKLLALTGVDHTQMQMVNRINELIAPVGGTLKKNVEVVVKQLTNTGKVLDRGSHPDYIEGDYAPISYIKNFNSKLPKGYKPVKFQPMLRGVGTLPLDIMEDTMAKLNFEKLKSTIIDSAASGGRSNLAGPNPIPQLATGIRINTLQDPEEYLEHINSIKPLEVMSTDAVIQPISSKLISSKPIKSFGSKNKTNVKKSTSKKSKSKTTSGWWNKNDKK